jgi:hypothetical protein
VETTDSVVYSVVTSEPLPHKSQQLKNQWSSDLLHSPFVNISLVVHPDYDLRNPVN